MKKMLILIAILLTVTSVNAQWNDRDSSVNDSGITLPTPAPAPSENFCNSPQSGWNDLSFPVGCSPVR